MSGSDALEVVRGEENRREFAIHGEAGTAVVSASVEAAPVPLIGNRRFWVYRDRIEAPAPAGSRMALLAAAFEALATEFADGGPLGVFATFGDREWLAEHPEAVWPESGFVYGGYGLDGLQVRVRYFEGARI